MPKIFYGTGVSDSGRGDFPELRVVNMIPETEATAEGLVLNSRPGLEQSGYTFGVGPIRGLYTLDGVLGGDLFAVSGDKLHSLVDGEVGVIDGTGPVYMSGFEDKLFVNAGGKIWGYDGTALTSVAFPDDADVLAMAIGASRVIGIRADTGIFYWSDPLSSTIDALSFATAENSPDLLKDILFSGDTAILFGSKTVEFWPSNSTDPNLPFSPLPGRTYQEGIRDTGCASLLGNTFAWITDNNQICLGTPEQVISTPTIEDKLEKSVTAKLWHFTMFQTEYLCLRLDDSTHCFTVRYGQWVELSSFGQPNWLPQCFSGRWFGSSVDNSLYQWSDDYSDFGEELERLVSAWVEIDTGIEQLFNILPRVNSGTTKSLVTNPIIELRISRNSGRTWGTWKQRSLKEPGDYDKKVAWRSLGTFRYPGGLLEFRVTDPTSFRFSGVTVNDGY